MRLNILVHTFNSLFFYLHPQSSLLQFLEFFFFHKNFRIRKASAISNAKPAKIFCVMSLILEVDRLLKPQYKPIQS